MKRSLQALILFSILITSAGLTIGLTFAPCYASVCSEKFFGLETRLHIMVYYSLIASIGGVLILRSCSSHVARISSIHIIRRRLRLLHKHLTVGVLMLAI